MGRGGSLSSGTCWQAATKIHTKTQAWLGGRSFSLTHSESLRVEDSSSIPFPPVPPGPPWRPATYVLAGPVGGGWRGNFKLSGQNVKFTHEFTQQKEGGEARAGTPHARVLSLCLFPPSSPTLLFQP